MAFMMDAGPTLIIVCPAFRKLNGNTLFSSPMTRKGVQADRPRGREWPRNHAGARRIAAAIPTRASTTVSGGSSTTATPTQKNAPPHSTESRTSKPHANHRLWFLHVKPRYGLTRR